MKHLNNWEKIRVLASCTRQRGNESVRSPSLYEGHNSQDREAHVFQRKQEGSVPGVVSAIPDHHTICPCQLHTTFSEHFKNNYLIQKMLRNEMERVKRGCNQMRTPPSLEIMGLGKLFFWFIWLTLCHWGEFPFEVSYSG